MYRPPRTRDLYFAQFRCIGTIKAKSGSWIKRKIKSRIQVDHNTMVLMVKMSREGVRAQRISALASLTKGISRDGCELSHEPFSIPHNSPQSCLRFPRPTH